MSKAEEIIEKIKNAKDETDEWWVSLYKEMEEYLESDISEEEKNKLLKLGYTEMLTMIYEGITSKGTKK